MSTFRSVRCLVLATAFLLTGALPLLAGEVHVSVAASMTEVFKELVREFSAQNDVDIIANYGPSGGLAKQIQMGAPADLYVSANPRWMEYLAEAGEIDTAYLKDFAQNRLVVVSSRDIPVRSLQDILTADRIGLGSPASVPAGDYARQALRKINLYDELLQRGKLVMAKDVRQALIYADRGETDLSFVYATDALLAERARVLFPVPDTLHTPIIYPIALTTTGADNDAALAFFSYITSPSGRKIIVDNGFTLP